MEEERDIGVMVTNNMKPTAQCTKAARTAQAVLSQISRAFHSRDRHIFIRLYKQYVRPHLEFSTQAWSPWLEQDKASLEKIQRRAVAIVSGLVRKQYEERLKELSLQTLEERRHQANMHMVHKIIHGGGGLDYNTWSEKASDSVRPTRTSTDPLNVKLNNGRLEVRRNFFSVRVAGQWNSVPSHLKQLRSAHHFKKAYRQFRENTMPVA